MTAVLWEDGWTLEEATEELERLRPQAMATATRILAERSKAEDAVQEAYARALQALATLRNRRAIKGWFRRIVVHCAMDLLSEAAVQAEPDKVQGGAPDERGIHVREALAQLKPEHQAVLALAFGDGLSHKELAEALDVPMGTVASRIHAAKAAFRKVWEEGND